jgi:hypothetical protein
VATLTLFAQQDARLLRRALDKHITLLSQDAANRYRVSSGSGEVPHRVVVNANGHIACDCLANAHGRRCSHAAYIGAYRAWEAAR